MPTPIVIPDLGVEVSEAQVDEWLKSVGESVAEGEQIAVISTPKATFELEAPATGYLKEITVAMGEIAAVGATIGIVDDA